MIIIEMLTEYDQKIIERIKSSYSHKKSIVIIHNLFKMESKVQVIEKATSDIKGAFYATDQCIPGSDVPYFIEKNDDKDCRNILHMILGKETCESGEFFNKTTIEFVRKTIQTENDIANFDLVEKINEFFEEKNNVYFQSLQESKAPKFALTDVEKNKKAVLKLQYNKELQLKIPEFNVLGGLKNYELKFHLYITNQPAREKIYYFELPGCKELPKLDMKCRVQEREQILSMTITNDLEFPKEYKCFEGGLVVGSYVKKIKINDEQGFYDADKKFTKYENGILQMKFVLKEDKEEI